MLEIGACYFSGLIEAVDVPASRHIKSSSTASTTDTASSVLLGSEIGVSGLTY